jgi:hypothetical protein
MKRSMVRVLGGQSAAERAEWYHMAMTGNHLIGPGERLHLPDNLLLGQGTVRSCYLHPDDPMRVVKTALGGDHAGEKANRNELKSYAMMLAAGGDLSRLSACHGLVATSRGMGLVCDCIRNADGSIAKTLWDLVVHEDDADIAGLQLIILDFCDYLIGNDLFLFDLNLKNIVVQIEGDGSPSPWAIDLKGPYDNKEFLKISTFVKYLGRRKMKRRKRQVVQRIAEYHERRESLRLLDMVIPARAIL